MRAPTFSIAAPSSAGAAPVVLLLVSGADGSGGGEAGPVWVVSSGDAEGWRRCRPRRRNP
ncbi:MAG: hypothetical protein H0U28_10030 [Nocardioidaceae bacterium]|nr:hypothetical protein [Nocardioidaceae bacterium]